MDTYSSFGLADDFIETLNRLSQVFIQEINVVFFGSPNRGMPEKSRDSVEISQSTLQQGTSECFT